MIAKQEFNLLYHDVGSCSFTLSNFCCNNSGKSDNWFIPTLFNKASVNYCRWI